MAVWEEREPSDPRDPVPHTEGVVAGVVAGWSVLGASRRGRGHAHAGGWREDALALAAAPEDGWCVLAVADGAGSCPLSRVGARVATQTAARWVQEHLQASDSPLARVDEAARAALHAVRAEAARREVPVGQLSCTLLLVLWFPAEEGGLVVSFQAGDGLIAAIEDDGTITPLHTGDSGEFAGETHFLTSEHTSATWEGRTRQAWLDAPPRAVIAATDGVSDDLTPLEKNGPIFKAGLEEALRQPQPGGLLALLGYEKRGSFDDRTVALAWRGAVGAERGA